MITKSLKVMLWGEEVGRLSWDGKRNVAFFEYNENFLKGSLDAFPIVAPINSPASKRPIMGDRETKIFRKLPPFLADSLPDAWGNQVFECWRIENGIKSITPLDILSFIGKRGMGALEFRPVSWMPGMLSSLPSITLSRTKLPYLSGISSSTRLICTTRS